VIKLTSNNAYIRRVDKLEAELLLVTMDCLRRCPNEISDTFWPPDSPGTKVPVQKPKEGQVKNTTTSNKPNPKNVGGQKRRRLRAANLRRGDV